MNINLNYNIIFKEESLDDLLEEGIKNEAKNSLNTEKTENFNILQNHKIVFINDDFYSRKMKNNDPVIQKKQKIEKEKKN
jgi:hypothetical protein